MRHYTSSKLLKSLVFLAFVGVGAGLVTTGLLSPGRAESTPKVAIAGLPDFTSLVETVTPSVVSISTRATIRDPRGGAPHSMLEQFFGAPQGRAHPRTQQGQGSGFVIDTEGHILTNNHVVADADEVRVSFPGDETEYPAEVVGTDEMTDVALLEVKTDRKLTPLPLGSAESVKVGEWVLAVGNPFGLDSTVTAGIVSAKGRRIGMSRYDDFIQTDASINPGNSGGPLINLAGEVVGVNSVIYSRTGGNIGIGFAIPIELAQEVARDLQAKGKVVRGWLGVAIQAVDADIIDAMSLPKDTTGVLIGEVEPDSPAERSGLEAGDVVTRWGGESIPSVQDFTLMVARTRPESKVATQLLRDGKPKKLTVRVGELAGREGRGGASEEKPGRLGLSLETTDEGLRVVAVEPSSAADKAGLRPGDLIVSVGEQRATSIRAFQRGIAKAADANKAALLRVERGNRRLYLAIRPLK